VIISSALIDAIFVASDHCLVPLSLLCSPWLALYRVCYRTSHVVWMTSRWRNWWRHGSAEGVAADDDTMFVGGAVTDALRRRFVRRNWLVPRRVMCILFWTGVLLIFVGMILVVTSQHKGRYVSIRLTTSQLHPGYFPRDLAAASLHRVSKHSNLFFALCL